MSNCGCPYKERNIGTENEYCPIIKKTVEGFVMCDCDWESCPDYRAEIDKEETKVKIETELIEQCRLDRGIYEFECELRDCCECRQYLDYASEEQLQLLGEK